MASNQKDPNPASALKEQMTGIYNPSGWAAYFRNGHLFVKRAPVSEGAPYPDFGCNCETYTEPAFLEVETLAPLVNLQPGQTATHVEGWWLFSDVPAGADDQWIDDQVLPLIRSTQL